MRSVLVSFGLLPAFMLVFSLPLSPATLEKRQSIANTAADVLNGVLPLTLLELPPLTLPELPPLPLPELPTLPA
ncbi:hypothetical protein G6F57_009344 [Rhizopus arrhizus]|uniref:Uncharacterized protein n=1 Tax=Rhizopus oryzae TaxID=64495 RepID=A0A9P6X3X8_RHIOR|nr:hypothetical protein G6F23_004490 [Rhizopus arrhizus]KAG1414683.1 hypothetical protein G6F58_006831 [Rhizopus delemar]KAG0758970.1 hypothetical protein G6F24_009411 [Rhizopus arrhizus]KAG0787181.1 hypothetical protein G6F22_007398 [Rhizopus arrhizus]KAG0793790.1 hypothetical protein G6F21_003358 [Rhizopus arrhizus]